MTGRMVYIGRSSWVVILCLVFFVQCTKTLKNNFKTVFETSFFPSLLMICVFKVFFSVLPYLILFVSSLVVSTSATDCLSVWKDQRKLTPE